MALAFSPKLMKELVFYGSYHNNKWNQLIHVVFVPAILWSFFVMLCHTREFLPLSTAVASAGAPAVVSANLVGNAAFLVYAVYAVYYVSLDLVAGAFAATAMLGMLVAANHTYATLGASLALKVAIGVNLFGWYMQVLCSVTEAFVSRQSVAGVNLIHRLMSIGYSSFTRFTRVTVSWRAASRRWSTRSGRRC